MNQAAFSSVRIQPANVRTRKGYAENGSGLEIGKTCSPQKIRAAVIAKRTAPSRLARRIQLANSLGAPVSRRPADHRDAPAAKEGTLASRLDAVPDSITASPIENTRNPAAAKSAPLRKNFKASSAVATI